MTIDQILLEADLAEEYPNSNTLNWSEIGFNTLSAWVDLNPVQGPEGIETGTFDVESVKVMFHSWWLSTHGGVGQ